MTDSAGYLRWRAGLDRPGLNSRRGPPSPCRAGRGCQDSGKRKPGARVRAGLSGGLSE
ncbi:MAG: hypothetical protein OXC41_01835 [Gammaproteobacteria bacterium]|nr:hypothetical protein [Gammaproteobacteria bacterium]